MSDIKLELPSAPDTSAIDIKDEGSLIVSNPTAMNFTGPGVTVTENPTGTAEVDIPGLQYWTESEDATTQQSTIFTPNNSATNVNAVLLPKGTGANLAQTPDGTTVGGNARGNYATDWQKRRTNANQVASGADSTISGGKNNVATGSDSTVGGGQNNSASGVNATIPGGTNCIASAPNSFSTGNSAKATGNTSVAFLINSTASGNQAFAAGQNANASGAGSKCLSFNSTASGTRATVHGNSESAIATADYCSVSGLSARGYLYGMEVMSTNPFNQTAFQYQGQNQKSELIAWRRGELVSAATFDLSLDGTGTTNLIIPFLNSLNNIRSWNILVKWTAIVEQITGTATGVTVGDLISSVDVVTYRAFRTPASSAIVGTPTVLSTHNDASMATAALAYSTGGATWELIPTFTAPTFAGGGTLTMRVSAHLILQEIATI